jgi:YD repeat-containing protein
LSNATFEGVKHLLRRNADQHYGYNAHGSVRALTDTTGKVTGTYDYDAFGNLIHSTGSTPSESVFAGELNDGDLHFFLGVLVLRFAT